MSAYDTDATLDGLPWQKMRDPHLDPIEAEEKMLAGLPALCDALNSPQFKAEREAIWRKYYPEPPSEAEIQQDEIDKGPDREFLE